MKSPGFALVNMRNSKTCGICAGYCWNVQGAAGPYRHVFFCDECGLERAKELGKMSGIRLYEIQRQALANASPNIGAYLDRLGKTELSELSGDEWLDFLATVLTEYEKAMREITGALL